MAVLVALYEMLPPGGIAVLFLAGVMLLLLAGLVFPRRRKRALPWRRRYAKKWLRRFRAGHDQYSPAQRFEYIRRMDPLLLEDVILCCFQQAGCRIRHTGYSGDGGIDGFVYYRRHTFLLQVKRYRGYISQPHVSAFAEAVAVHRAIQGLFIHTGKTSQNLRERADGMPLRLLGGSDTILLLLDSPLSVTGLLDQIIESEMTQTNANARRQTG